MDHELQDMEVFNPQLPFTEQVTQNWISGGVYRFHFGQCPSLSASHVATVSCVPIECKAIGCFKFCRVSPFASLVRQKDCRAS